MIKRLLNWYRGWKRRRDFARMHAGTAAAFAVGQKAFEQKGVSPKLVEAVRLSIENDKRLAERRAQFDRESG